MQIVLDIADESLIERVVKTLNSFKQDGITIKKIDKSYKNNSVSYIKNLQGLGKELYKDVNSDKYIRDLRDEW